MIYINLYIDYKYIAKDLILICTKFERSYCNARNLGSVLVYKLPYRRTRLIDNAYQRAGSRMVDSLPMRMLGL